MPDSVLIAAVEGGGTSFVVAVAEIDTRDTTAAPEKNDPRILHRAEIDSSHDDPSRTLEECAAFFRAHKNTRKEGYRALGVAMFGPLGCNPDDTEHYGTILVSTPKQSWRGVDVLTPLIEACRTEGRDLAVKIDTDVNAPAVAEFLSETTKTEPNAKTKAKTKTAPSISSLAYVTIGTGVGVGLVVHGKPVHGRMHPEGGHVPVQPLEGDTFAGYSWGANSSSPFKGKHTVESMTSSVALTERLQELNGSGKDLDRACLAKIHDDDHEVWDHAANALANLCVTLALVASVEKIVLGGGVMKRNGLIEKVRNRTRVLLNGYLGELTDADLEAWIAKSSYGSDVGLVGAIVLAEQAVSIAEGEGEGGNGAAGVGRRELTDATIKKLKQTAFNAGLWHGFLLGASAVYVGVCVWARSGKSPGRR
eukprot:jgi/Psemu1/286637/fgenesh1_pg.145_\